MREYKKIKIETEELTKVLCDTCKKEICKCGYRSLAESGEAYIPTEVITVSRNREYCIQPFGRDIFDFCSLECFLEWAKGEVDVFNVSFHRDALNTLASEYARLKSRDSRLNDTEIKEEQKMTRLDKTLAVTKQCQDKFIEFNISWAMNNISKTIDMHLIPRIEEAKDQVDTRYCQGMLDAISDLLTDKLCKEIQSKIYSKQVQLGILPF